MAHENHKLIRGRGVGDRGDALGLTAAGNESTDLWEVFKIGKRKMQRPTCTSSMIMMMSYEFRVEAEMSCLQQKGWSRQVLRSLSEAESQGPVGGPQWLLVGRSEPSLQTFRTFERNCNPPSSSILSATLQSLHGTETLRPFKMFSETDCLDATLPKMSSKALMRAGA